MPSRPILFIISISLLILCSGCQPEQTDAPAGPKLLPPDTETAAIEMKTDPQSQYTNLEVSTKPEKTDSPAAEPDEIKPPEPDLPPPKPPEPPADTVSEPDVVFRDKCADILSRFVNDKGRVDYKALKRRRYQLRELLDEFAKLKPEEYNRWPNEDKIALWIDVYNIQMLNIIVKNYPIVSIRVMRLFWHPNSIRHIKGIWNKYKIIVMDEEFTLREIEQRFFAGKFDDPRVFLALCRASLSGPALQRKPYYGDNLNRRLDEQVRKFISRDDVLRIDKSENTVYLSAMFEPTWHGKHFIGKYGTTKKFKDRLPATAAVLNFLTNYISEQDKTYLEVENYSIKHITYDWRLNE